MQFFAPVVALLAAVATAQNSTVGGQPNAIAIPNGAASLNIAAGPNTITWGNPSSGTVTIKLQVCCGVTTPTDGVVLASGIPSSAGSASFTVDPSQVVAGQQYTIEIVDDTGAADSNFSPPFLVSGATGTATMSGASSATDSTMSGTMSGTMTSTGSSSGTATVSSSSRSGSRTTTTSASATGSETSAPNSANKITGAQGGLLAFMAAVVAIL